MGLRSRLDRLERDVQEGMISIPQRDGSVARFSQAQLREAFLRHYDAVRAIANGDTPPQPHPLQRAIEGALHREQWHSTFFGAVELEEVEDLSEK